MMRFKFGPLILSRTLDLEPYARAVPTVVKSVGHVDHVIWLHDRLGDLTTFLLRHNGAGSDFATFENQLGLTNPQEAARRWVAYTLQEVAAYRDRPFYYESFNEVSKYHMVQYGEFEAERQRLMAAEGLRCCIANFSVGNPDVSDSDDDGREDYWPQFRPALEACHEFKNVLGLHEYGGGWMSLWFGPENQHDAVMERGYCIYPEGYEEGWLFGRYRKVWRRHIQPQGLTDIRIVLTEFGLDLAGEYTLNEFSQGQHIAGWKTCPDLWRRTEGRTDPEWYYFEQLKWADRQLQQDYFVIGATIFTHGNDVVRWNDYDIAGPVGDAVFAESRRALRRVTPPEGLYLRPRPRQEGVALDVLQEGDQIVVMYDSGPDWAFVKTKAGFEGFVMTQWLGLA